MPLIRRPTMPLLVRSKPKIGKVSARVKVKKVKAKVRTRVKVKSKSKRSQRVRFVKKKLKRAPKKSRKRK